MPIKKTSHICLLSVWYIRLSIHWRVLASQMSPHRSPRASLPTYFQCFPWQRFRELTDMTMRSVWTPQREKRRNSTLSVTHFGTKIFQLLTDHGVPLTCRNSKEVKPSSRPYHLPRHSQGHHSPTPSQAWSTGETSPQQDISVNLTSFRISDIENNLSFFFLCRKNVFKQNI